MTLISYTKIREELHGDPEFVREHEALAEEFEVADTLIRARRTAEDDPDEEDEEVSR